MFWNDKSCCIWAFSQQHLVLPWTWKVYEDVLWFFFYNVLFYHKMPRWHSFHVYLVSCMILFFVETEFIKTLRRAVFFFCSMFFSLMASILDKCHLKEEVMLREFLFKFYISVFIQWDRVVCISNKSLFLSAWW